MYLPTVAEQPGVAKSEKAVELEKPEEQACVLVVEDDAAILELAGRFLKTAGHQVVTARDGVQALEIVRERGASIGVVVTDVVMPKMRGTNWRRDWVKFCLRAKVIFYVGISGTQRREQGSGGRRIVSAEAVHARRVDREGE